MTLLGTETEEFMRTDGEIKEAVMLAEMRKKAMMDEQSRLNGARRECELEALKETIIDNLSDLGNVSQNLISLVNEEDNMDVLKSWTKIAVMAESLDEFEEKIKYSIYSKVRELQIFSSLVFVKSVQ